MYQKILVELKKKFPGLSQLLLGQIATTLAKTVTTDEAIQPALDALDTLPISITEFADITQRESDRRVNEALAKAKKPSGEPGDEPGTNDDPKPDPAKPTNTQGDSALLAEFKKLNARLDGIERAGRTKSLTEKLEAALKDKKIPVFMAKGRTPEKEEELETVINDIETDWKSLQQDTTNEEIDQMPVPKVGKVKTKPAEVKKVDDDIMSYVKAQSSNQKLGVKKPESTN